MHVTVADGRSRSVSRHGLLPRISRVGQRGQDGPRRSGRRHPDVVAGRPELPSEHPFIPVMLVFSWRARN